MGQLTVCLDPSDIARVLVWWAHTVSAWHYPLLRGGLHAACQGLTAAHPPAAAAAATVLL